MIDIHSMTGFGLASGERDGLTARVEIKSVNNRGIKITVRSRPSLGTSEKLLRDMLADALVRGSVDVYVDVQRAASAAFRPLRDERGREAVEALRRLARDLGLRDDISARDLVLIPGIFENGSDEPVSEAEWPVVRAAAEEALSQLLAMRRTEGGRLAAILLDLSGPIETFARETEKNAPAVVERARERLRTRLEELCPNGLSAADSQSLEREVCLFADRADVREELDRLGSHLSQYRDALGKKGEVGKRLEFLAQEFLREINTTASKANDTGIVRGAIEAKLAVEKIKEQCANLV